MHLSIESSLQLRDTAQSQKSFLSFYNHGISNKFGPLDQEPWARKQQLQTKAHQMMEGSMEKQKILPVEIVRTHLQVHSI